MKDAYVVMEDIFGKDERNQFYTSTNAIGVFTDYDEADNYVARVRSSNARFCWSQPDGSFNKHEYRIDRTFLK